jgi:hypothetical protein
MGPAYAPPPWEEPPQHNSLSTADQETQQQQHWAQPPAPESMSVVEPPSNNASLDGPPIMSHPMYPSTVPAEMQPTDPYSATQFATSSSRSNQESTSSTWSPHEQVIQHRIPPGELPPLPPSHPSFEGYEQRPIPPVDPSLANMAYTSPSLASQSQHPSTPAQATRDTSGGNYTRTLVGPLSANAARVRDEHGHVGIFFVFQDLSVRIEGASQFRQRRS